MEGSEYTFTLQPSCVPFDKITNFNTAHFESVLDIRMCSVRNYVERKKYVRVNDVIVVECTAINAHRL